MQRTRLLIAAILGLSTFIVASPNSPVEAAPGSTVGERTTETFAVGPYSLAPEGQPGDQVNQIFAPVDRPDGDIAIHSITWALVDGDGNEVTPDQAHLHHLVLIDSARPDALCNVSSRFAGTGRELTDFELPEGYAYFSPEGDWQGVYHLMNLSDTAIDLALEYTITYSDAAEADELDVEPFFLDVDGCWGDSEFVVPGDGGPDSVFAQSNRYVMERDATIVAGGGHLHAGGIDVTLSEVDGPEICRAVLENLGHGGEHGHFGIEPCGIVDYDVQIGDELDLTARYENDTPIPDAMGIMVTYLHFTSPPPPPPTIDITSVEITDGALVVDLICNQTFEVYLYGDVEQAWRDSQISGNGYSNEQQTCSPDGLTVEMPLTGDGILRRWRDVDYTVEAYGQVGRHFVTETDTGTVKVLRRTDLGVPQPDEGELDLFIWKGVSTNADGHHVVQVAVPCSGDFEGEIQASIRQRVGRKYIYARGYEYGSAVCTNGYAAFSVPMTYPTGRFIRGDVTITASVYVYNEQYYEYSTRSTVGTVIHSSPPRDNAAIYEPDPESRVTIDEVVRTDDGIVVRATLTGCTDGATVFADTSVTPLVSRWKRVFPQGTYGYINEPITCEGGEPLEIELALQDDISKPRVGVQFSVYEEFMVGNEYQFTSSTNAGQFRIR